MNELFTKEFDSDSNDEDYVPTQKELEASNENISLKLDIKKPYAHQTDA